MTLVMYDSIEVSTVPPNPPAVAGYVGGFWPTYSSLVARFPKAHHLSIAVNASENADCLDIERGDASPSQGPDWVKRQLSRGVVRPVVYASASDMPSVKAALTAAGIKRNQYRMWLAHFTGVPPQPPFEQGADGVQWTSSALGRNLDQSVLLDNFFNDVKPVPHINPSHYDWFFVGPFDAGKYRGLNERRVVEQYDGARKHPALYAAYLKLVLRPKLEALAGRVANAAIHSDPYPDKPSWDKFHRGWRYQQLIHRAQGVKFV